MYKDSSKPDEIKIFKTISNSWYDFKNNLLQNRGYFTAIGLLITVTALFLAIDGDNSFLRKVQSLLLFISSASIAVVLISSFKTYFYNKYSELYHAMTIMLQMVIILFLVNIFGYLFSEFNDELLYYVKWMGIPVFGIVMNIGLIYIFKLLKKHNIEGSQLESFFLVSLNAYIGSKYILSGLEFWETMKRLTRLEFYNLLMVYLLFITIWSELRPRAKDMTKTSAVIEGITFIMLVVLPFLIRYLLPLFIS